MTEKNHHDPTGIELLPISQKKSRLAGIPTGISGLDKILGGWQNNNLILLSGAPGIGESNLLINFACAAAQSGRKVALFSLKQSKPELRHHIFARQLSIPLDKLKTDSLSPQELEKLKQFKKDESFSIILNDKSDRSIFDFRVECLRLKRKYNIELVIVDYLQLLSADQIINHPYSHYSDDAERIYAVAQALKKLATELGLPIIAVCPLQRAAKVIGQYKLPQLKHLNEEAYGLLNCPDVILFLYKEANKAELLTKKGNEEFFDLVIAKNANGEKGNIKLKLRLDYLKLLARKIE